MINRKFFITSGSILLLIILLLSPSSIAGQSKARRRHRGPWESLNVINLSITANYIDYDIGKQVIEITFYPPEGYTTMNITTFPFSYPIGLSPGQLRGLVNDDTTWLINRLIGQYGREHLGMANLCWNQRAQRWDTC